jgi:hypothetical protein
MNDNWQKIGDAAAKVVERLQPRSIRVTVSYGSREPRTIRVPVVVAETAPLVLKIEVEGSAS